MKLKKYTMEQLSKVKVVLNEKELNMLKGGYTVLENGLVQVSYDELMIIYGNPFGVPSHIFEELGIDINNAGISEIHSTLQQIGYFNLTVDELGVFGSLWGLSSESSSSSEPDESSVSEPDESSVSEEGNNNEGEGNEGENENENEQDVVFTIDYVVAIAKAYANVHNISSTSLEYYSMISKLYYGLLEHGISNVNSLTYEIRENGLQVIVYFRDTRTGTAYQIVMI